MKLNLESFWGKKSFCLISSNKLSVQINKGEGCFLVLIKQALESNLSNNLYFISLNSFSFLLFRRMWDRLNWYKSLKKENHRQNRDTLSSPSEFNSSQYFTAQKSF